MNLPSFEDILSASKRIAPFVHRTPVLTSQTFNALTGASLFFKCENMQRIGAFKIRGATNAVQALSDTEARHGVATHSSGNHAQALASAAGLRGIRCFVVMPETATVVKQHAVRDYGAEITFCEPTLEARERTLAEVVERTGAAIVHPFDNKYVIAGQGTAALEFLEIVSDLDVVLAPIGGGGLMSGTALAVRALSPTTRIYGVEPELANDAYRSFTTGRLHRPLPPQSIADGLLTSLSERTFQIIKQNVDAIFTVTEEEIIEATRLLWERMKMIVEPSGAVPFAAALYRKFDITGKRIGIILSGGNVDLRVLPWQSTPKELVEHAN